MGARRGLTGDHGGRVRAAVHDGSWRPAPTMPVVGSRWRTGGSSRWTRGSTRRTCGSSSMMRGSSCSTRSWWQIPATPAGNRRRRGSRRRRSGRRRRSKYLATAAALKVRGDGGGTLPGGRQSRSLAAPAPGDARATAEEDDGGGGTCL